MNHNEPPFSYGFPMVKAMVHPEVSDIQGPRSMKRPTPRMQRVKPSDCPVVESFQRLFWFTRPGDVKIDFNGDLMGFNGDLMGFNGDLIVI